MKKSLKISYVLLILTFYANTLIAQDTSKIRGITLDSTNASIDYVNVGIIGKKLGTVSNENGFFHLTISHQNLNDSLTFSRIGYSSKRISIAELIGKRDVKVILSPKISVIEELTFQSKRLRRKNKGNVARSKTVVLGVVSDSSILGNEVGTIIKLPKKPIIIKDFNFHISSNDLDSVILRLNIYDHNKDEIGKNLLNESIYFTIRNYDVGDFKVDLNKYKILVSNSVLLSTEIVAIYDSDTTYSAGKNDIYKYKLFFSGSIIGGSKSYKRNISLATWEKIPYSFSPGFWITYLK